MLVHQLKPTSVQQKEHCGLCLTVKMLSLRMVAGSTRARGYARL